MCIVCIFIFKLVFVVGMGKFFYYNVGNVNNIYGIIKKLFVVSNLDFYIWIIIFYC